MVTFVLHSQDDNKVEFFYYPENDRHKGAGVILYNKNSKKLDINRYADIDWLERLTNEEIAEKHCDITDFIETSHKAKIYAFYGTPVLMEIHKQIELGSFPAEGKVV